MAAVVSAADAFSVVLEIADDDADEKAARVVRTEDTLATDAAGTKASTLAEAKRATRAVEVNKILMVKCRAGGGPLVRRYQARG